MEEWKIIFRNKFDEYLTFFVSIAFIVLISIIIIVTNINFLWCIGIIVLIFYIDLESEYLKIYLSKDTLIIKRPLSLFRKPKMFTNSDIIKVIYEIKAGRDSPKIIIYTQSSKGKGKSFRFINSGREMQRFFTALEGLGIVVEYPIPDA